MKEKSVKKLIPVVYRNMLNFSGRTGREQFWVDVLVLFMCTIVASIVAVLLSPNGEVYGLLCGLWGVANISALIATILRRLNDAGYPRKYILFLLLPIAGIFFEIYYLTRESDHDDYQKSKEWYKRYMSHEKPLHDPVPSDGAYRSDGLF